MGGHQESGTERLPAELYLQICGFVDDLQTLLNLCLTSRRLLEAARERLSESLKLIVVSDDGTERPDPVGPHVRDGPFTQYIAVADRASTVRHLRVFFQDDLRLRTMTSAALERGVNSLCRHSFHAGGRSEESLWFNMICQHLRQINRHERLHGQSPLTRLLPGGAYLAHLSGLRTVWIQQAGPGYLWRRQLDMRYRRQAKLLSYTGAWLFELATGAGLPVHIRQFASVASQKDANWLREHRQTPDPELRWRNGADHFLAAFGDEYASREQNPSVLDDAAAAIARDAEVVDRRNAFYGWDRWIEVLSTRPCVHLKANGLLSEVSAEKDHPRRAGSEQYRVSYDLRDVSACLTVSLCLEGEFHLRVWQPLQSLVFIRQLDLYHISITAETIRHLLAGQQELASVKLEYVALNGGGLDDSTWSHVFRLLLHYPKMIHFSAVRCSYTEPHAAAHVQAQYYSLPACNFREPRYDPREATIYTPLQEDVDTLREVLAHVDQDRYSRSGLDQLCSPEENDAWQMYLSYNRFLQAKVLSDEFRQTSTEVDS